MIEAVIESNKVNTRLATPTTLLIGKKSLIRSTETKEQRETDRKEKGMTGIKLSMVNDAGVFGGSHHITSNAERK
jgi:hypothetical protein